jgi:gelsolin
MPQPGGVAPGFKHVEVNEQEHVNRLYVCQGKHVVHVKEARFRRNCILSSNQLFMAWYGFLLYNQVPFTRSSLNHDDVFILDTKSRIFQFNGSNSSIQERAKALEVVQYIKDTFHDGKCDIGFVGKQIYSRPSVILKLRSTRYDCSFLEDGRLMADEEAGEFWGFFGGFAPLPRRAPVEDNEKYEETSVKLLW